MSSGYATSETVLGSAARTRAQKSLETHCFVHSPDFIYLATFGFSSARSENAFVRKLFTRDGNGIGQNKAAFQFFRSFVLSFLS